ncbi:hypothetical protein DSM106972_008110 [Dulcicalothrix desertica PCC 7102]|uniref:Uncharacterized protein n=1 Tax=Dulcicalothrix desertica PCC 7102 TaxID=232991 RepID=A0A433VW51_9CYAN|nr:hypothetical protein [Dulcicalothrix desertica]RUT10316.1 hypothetical protein DSM106972_008110 [Dulcicalothrix desertica PCC 7102]TWH40712.1 hypothetical protein CAL7102_10064 [Dulcicalothrix desertica PCC 7102]
MQTLRYWFSTILLISQYNPYELIENLMLALAAIMIIVSIIFPAQKPYIALGLSFAIGSAMSILVRQATTPSRQTRFIKIGAILILIISLYDFIDVIHNT